MTPPTPRALLLASFYDNAFSKQLAVRLRRSAEALGLKCRLFDRRERAAGAGTPKALMEILKAYPGEDVLLVDPDAAMLRRPDILLDETDYDIAAHYDQDSLLVEGPVFFANTARVRGLIAPWEELNARFPERSEPDNLSQLLGRKSSALVVRRLPVTYAWVEHDHRNKYPGALPVFTHFKTQGLSSTRIRIPG